MILKNLIILDLTNNHQGSLKHGLTIIESMGKIVNKFKMKAELNFNFVNLILIHPNHQKGSKAKHIPRFLETKLETQDYRSCNQRLRNMECILFTSFLTKHR